MNTGVKNRKLKVLHKSGSGAIQLKLFDLFPYLTWLEPYLFERETGTNYEDNKEIPLTNQTSNNLDDVESSSQQRQTPRKYHRLQVEPSTENEAKTEIYSGHGARRTGAN